MTPNQLLATTVAEVLAANPAAARSFIDRGMGCVGCTFAPFETIAEVARVYAIAPDELAASLASLFAKHSEGIPQ